MRLYDAHNHLQDDRFSPNRSQIVQEAIDTGVVRMVVNGSCESDWPEVAALAEQYPEHVLPAFGYHPWYLGEQTPQWKAMLETWLDRFPNAVVGEIGLDRWILNQTPERLARYAPGMKTQPPSLDLQEEALRWQLDLARERCVSATLHCLDAFGRMLEILNTRAPHPRGLLLHSYGGSAESGSAFARHGAYFGYAGYFAHERKQARRDVFAQLPLDRILVETDAPDQLPPPALQTHACHGPDGAVINHPANLHAVYESLATVRGLSLDETCRCVEANFTQLFGRPVAPQP